MDAIDLMMEEHKLIKRMLLVIRRACFGIMNGEDIIYDDFVKMIDFVRNYADRHHHNKEEVVLFSKMMEELGLVAEKLVKNGMLVEHDLGRLFMLDLEDSIKRVKNGDDFAKLDVIAHAVGYCNLLARHIEKEDDLVYMFARKNLSVGVIAYVNEACEKSENRASELGIQKKYTNLVEALEKKYLV
ncbi:MAG: hemerythrin domain-containing protein [Lachnospirales bacterium]